MRTKAMGAVLALFLFMTGMVAAQQDQRCEAPDAYIQPFHKTARAAATLRNTKTLNILIVSSMPAQTTRVADKLRSYPAFLEGSLKERLPNYEFHVTVHSEPRKSIKQIVAALPEVLQKNKPNLVILQTGTVEAIGGVDPDKYERKLTQAVEMIAESGADLILVNPQYGPRISFAANAGSLNDRIRRVASYSDVSLFNRYDIMRYWSEKEAFDFSALKSDGTFEAVHRCLGRMLAEFVSRAASFSEIAKAPQ